MSNLHVNLDEANKHTPKGFDSAVNNTFLTKDEQGLSTYKERMTLDKAINFVDGTIAPPTTANGDVYVLIGSGTVDAGWGSADFDDWVIFQNGIPVKITPLSGYLCYDTTASQWKEYDGTDWVTFGGGGAIDTIFTGGTMTAPSTITMGANNLQFLSSGSGIFKVDSNGNSGGATFYEYRAGLSTTPRIVQRQYESGSWAVGADLFTANEPSLSFSASGTTSVNVKQNNIKNFVGLYNGVESFSVNNKGDILSGTNAVGTSYLSFTSALGTYLKGAINSSQPILRGADQNGNVVFRLNNSGSLAVGHGTASQTLDVQGTTLLGGDTQIDGALTLNQGTGVSTITGTGASDTRLEIQNSNTGALTRTRWNNQLAIGTLGTTATQLGSFYQGKSHILGFGSQDLVIATAATDIDFAVDNGSFTAPSLKMKVSSHVSIPISTGKAFVVGVGVDDPSVRFQVHGGSALNGATQIDGQTTIQGTGTTSGTTALLVQNSASTELLKVLDDGSIYSSGSKGVSGTFNYGGTTGEIATMTFTNGILTATTTHP